MCVYVFCKIVILCILKKYFDFVFTLQQNSGILFYRILLEVSILLRSYAVWTGKILPTFRRSVLPLRSRRPYRQGEKSQTICFFINTAIRTPNLV